ncbi:hypothetical protein [Marinobacter antarcticus]|nr:hypothetical protein [Marinobacter antarcticus]
MYLVGFLAAWWLGRPSIGVEHRSSRNADLCP